MYLFFFIFGIIGLVNLMDYFEGLFLHIFFVLFFISLFKLSIFLFKLIYGIVNRRKFFGEYGIKLSSRFKVSKKKNNSVLNFYILSYPRWFFSNKDGSRNKVRSNNSLICPDSTLNFERYIVRVASPILILNLVNDLRDKYGDNCIEMNGEEIKKCNELKKEREFINSCNKVENLINKFSDQPTDFENFCADIYEKLGYKVKVTPKSCDGGYDLLLTRNGSKSIVECKCYDMSCNIGRPLIQKLVGANQAVHAAKMIFVTTSDFTKTAKEYAKKVGVELINGKTLIKLVNDTFDVNENCVITRAEWNLTFEDLKKHFPPDV